MPRRRDSNERAPEIAKVIGKLIVSLRQGKLSREQLAERANCHPNSLGAIERGESCPTIETLHHITKALDLSISEFFKLAEH